MLHSVFNAAGLRQLCLSKVLAQTANTHLFPHHQWYLALSGAGERQDRKYLVAHLTSFAISMPYYLGD